VHCGYCVNYCPHGVLAMLPSENHVMAEETAQ
ncbi:MAG: 4Fe-4S binding protein, partial [Chloroflexi bacterium]|nr:4Fe-4S binding protein [Chloroflexota bacterium]